MRFDWYLIKRWFRFAYQRWTRGWSDRDTWNLDHTIAQFALPRLRRFRRIHGGYPSDFESQEQWNAAIDDMIYAMEAIIRDLHSVDYQRMDRGCELLGTYFRNLWW